MLLVSAQPKNIEIAPSQLKSFALLLSNVLRDFDPETMFWRNESPIVFSNYDKEGFTPYQPVRKAFSVQTILESLARSCGYKSYKALLSDDNKPGTVCINIFDLNPNPRNAYYTEYWEVFARNITLSALHCWDEEMCKDANGSPTYFTYRNFIQHEQKITRLMPYIGLGMNKMCNTFQVFKSKLEIGDRHLCFKHVSPLTANPVMIDHYYSVALSVFLTAVRSGLVKIEKQPKKTQLPARKPKYIGESVEEEKEYLWTIQGVPLRKFLVHEQWSLQDFDDFKEHLIVALQHFFNVELSIKDQGDNPLDSQFNLIVPYDAKALFRKGRSLSELHEKMKVWVAEQANAVADDKNYYTHLDIKSIQAINSGFRPEEFSWETLNALTTSNNISEHEIYGTKAFWLNQCFHIIAPEAASFDFLLKYKDDVFADRISSDVLGRLYKYKLYDASKNPFAYHFAIEGISSFIKNTNKLVLPTDIPKTITIKCPHPMDENILKLVVHAQILAALPKDSFDFNMYSKYTGNPNEIIFMEVEALLANPKLKVKKLAKLERAELAVDFKVTDIIHSINFERMEPQLSQTFGLKPPSPIIHWEYQQINFDAIDLSYPDFIFTQGKSLKYACLINIGLVDTLYKSEHNFEPESGWNHIAAKCELASLKITNTDEIKLDICFSKQEVAEKNRIQTGVSFLNYLQTNKDFMELINEYIESNTSDWECCKSFMKEQRSEDSCLHTLYKYTTIFPNGTEIF